MVFIADIDETFMKGGIAGQFNRLASFFRAAGPGRIINEYQDRKKP
jgi:hypothetical protein